MKNFLHLKVEGTQYFIDSNEITELSISEKFIEYTMNDGGIRRLTEMSKDEHKWNSGQIFKALYLTK